MKYIHEDLANGRWNELSLIEQLANIGSEVSRTINWKDKDEKNSMMAFARTQDLFALTFNDPKNNRRLKEVARARELFTDWYYGENIYNSTAADWQKYFLQFAIAARIGK